MMTHQHGSRAEYFTKNGENYNIRKKKWVKNLIHCYSQVSSMFVRVKALYGIYSNKKQ